MKYVSPTTPMKHQKEAQHRLTLRPRKPTSEDVMAWLMEQGTGKTKVVLDEWQEGVSGGRYDDLLVVSRKGSIRNWYEDKSDAQPSELRVHLDPRLYKNLVVAAWGRSSAKKSRLDRLLRERKRNRALFVHIESLSAIEDAANLCREFLSAGRRVLFAIDESTLIRHGSANRTAVIMELRDKAVARRIMTGLVTPKSPLDLFWQFYFLDWRILGHEEAITFKNRYAIVKKRCFVKRPVMQAKLRSLCGLHEVNKVTHSRLSDAFLRVKLQKICNVKTEIPAGVPRAKLIKRIEDEIYSVDWEEAPDMIKRLGGYVQQIESISGYKNVEELQTLIAPYSYRVLKDECLDLKPKIYQTRDVYLTDEQKRHYREIREFATTMLESGDYVVTDAVIAQMIRLHQIVCGHVVDENKKTHDLKSNRIPEIMNVLAEHSGKSIIWCTYRREVDKIVAAIEKEYGPGSCAQFHGGNTRTRSDDERRFLGDPVCRSMVSTQGAGGFGNTWNVANLTIYAANSYDLELRMQSEDRNHRKGQHDHVTYVDLIARGTVEEPIIQCLRKKIDLATQITGENYREWII